jgi:hypothetical protein
MVTKPNIFSTGQLPTGPQWDANFSTLYDYINGNIEASSIVSASATTSKFNDGTLTAGKIATDVDFSNTQEFCFQIDGPNDVTTVSNFRRQPETSYHYNSVIEGFPTTTIMTGTFNGRNGHLLFMFWYELGEYITSAPVAFTQRLENNFGGTNQITTLTGADIDNTHSQNTSVSYHFRMIPMAIYSNTDSAWILLGCNYGHNTI